VDGALRAVSSDVEAAGGMLVQFNYLKETSCILFFFKKKKDTWRSGEQLRDVDASAWSYIHI